ncbi:MAG: two-component system, OmpR family, sensor histidine kinase ResE [Patescibacteria group bacterium]|nr:two-component system, OmpR family, sensor histidine kinase ResE [Patescibacteria group bacterium]
MLVALVPLTVSQYFLASSAHLQLLKAASSKQQAVANYLSNNVSSYLADNVKSLNNLAQLESTGKLSNSDLDYNMAVLFQQNPGLQRLAILNAAGQEKQVFDNNGRVTNLVDNSKSDAFKAVNFLNGKAYVSSVSYTEQKNPRITIAVPILKSDFSQKLNNLQDANFGTYSSADDLNGAVVATYDVKDLWGTVLSTTVGKGGYAYVVDGFGNLIAHPDSQFLEANTKLTNVEATKQSIDGNFDTRQTVSETGEKVISTPKTIPNSGWAVIVEEPVSSIYSVVNSYVKLAVIVGFSTAGLALVISLFFGRQITEPIKKLSKGAKRMGAGQFDYPIDIKSRDELQDLAETFNNMGLSLNKLVTELKTNNINLGVEKDKLDSIIESATDGIIALDQDLKILSINPPAAQLVKRGASELVGRGIIETFAWFKDERPVIVELTRPGTYQYTDVVLKDGDKVYYLDLVVSVISQQGSSAHGSEVAAIVTIHDLTKSRELDFMKLDFIAIAAHELRTPLTVIRGYLDMLNTEAVGQMSVYNIENLQKVIQGGNDLRNLINKLLNIARIERGEMEIFIEKLDLTKLIRDNVIQHKNPAESAEITLLYEADTESHVFVPADPSSITEVLNNLLGNAIKFNKAGNTIKVSLKVEDDIVRVEVADDGPGIPQELRDKLFTKFYRAERSLISGTRGTGLGLFISRTIIELQHGEIGIMPAAERGVTFYFTLPIYNPELHDKLISINSEAGGIRGWFKKNPNR